MKHKIRPEDPIEAAIIILLTVCLCANAGFINGCSILSRIEVTTSHMTGNVSHMALFTLQGQYNHALVILYIFLSFFTGAGIAGALVPENPVLFGRVFGFMLMLQAMVQMASGLCGKYLPDSYWWWCFGAAAAGIQNATFAKFTGNLIRTTHMTGVVNDIAFLIGRLVMGRPVLDAWRLRFLVPSLLAFFTGGLMAYVLYSVYQRTAMFFGAGLVFVLGVAYTVYVFFIHHTLPRSRAPSYHNTVADVRLGVGLPLTPPGPAQDALATVIHDALSSRDMARMDDGTIGSHSFASSVDSTDEAEVSLFVVVIGSLFVFFAEILICDRQLLSAMHGQSMPSGASGTQIMPTNNQSADPFQPAKELESPADELPV
jgi:uncharacterized membrane protein YoaK (UPF0700 family)